VSRRGSTLVAAGILLSRVAGFVRLRAMGHLFATGGVIESFNAAFRIPNILQNLLGEGVLSASFIPVYSRLLAEGREEEAGRVAGAIAGLLAVVASLLVLLGVLAAEPLTRIIAPGFTGERFELTVTLMRILFPGIGLLVLSAWCLGVLNSHRRFFLSYVAPVLWNGAQVAALVGAAVAGLAPASIAVALAWGALAGSALQLGLQLPAVLRLLGGLRPSLDLGLEGVRRTLRALGPVIAGRGIVQLMTYVELALASLLALGAVAVLGFAQPLYILPVSLFGMAVAASELPELSDLGTEEAERVRERLRAGLARIAFFVVPTALVFVLLGEVVVAAVYESGAFGGLEARLVWLTLAGFSLGLLSTTSSRLLQSSLYAIGQTRVPALVSAGRLVISAGLGAVLMLQLDQFALGPGGSVELVGELPATAPLPVEVREQEGLYRLGAVGLALAAAVASWVEYGLLRRAVRRRIGVTVDLGGGTLARVAAAAAAAVALGVVLAVATVGLHPLLRAPLVLGPAGLAYLGLARALGLEELPPLRALLRRRRDGGRGGPPEPGGPQGPPEGDGPGDGPSGEPPTRR